MVPTRDQIELMAYHRWLRRDRAHGFDRVDWLAAEKEVTFQLNYETLIEFSLASPTQLTIGGDDRLSRCRFCERTSRHTEFSRPRPVVQLPVETPLYSAQICDECDADCREPLASACDRLWRGLQSGDTSLKNLSRSPGSMAIFKSLVTSALLIMPESETGYFTDTLEWAINPDAESDRDLFAGTVCQIYAADFLREQPSISLSRRKDDDAPFPYMVFFLSWGGFVVQIALPMSTRDEDLDGRSLRTPQRSFASGHGEHFCEAPPTTLPLVDMSV